MPNVPSLRCPCGWAHRTERQAIMYCRLSDMKEHLPTGRVADYGELLNGAETLKETASKVQDR